MESRQGSFSFGHDMFSISFCDTLVIRSGRPYWRLCICFDWAFISFDVVSEHGHLGPTVNDFWRPGSAADDKGNLRRDCWMETLPSDVRIEPITKGTHELTHLTELTRAGRLVKECLASSKIRLTTWTTRSWTTLLISTRMNNYSVLLHSNDGIELDVIIANNKLAWWMP